VIDAETTKGKVQKWISVAELLENCQNIVKLWLFFNHSD
jgi:hypothetical protein